MTNHHGRSEWTAAAVRQKAWLVRPPRVVVIHHSGSDAYFGNNVTTHEGQSAFMRSLYAYGMNRDGAGCEYNELVLNATEAWEGFGPTVPGAHIAPQLDPATGQKGSLSLYGLCLWGNFMTREPTWTELRSLADVIRRRIDQGYLAPDVVLRGHRNYAATPCPGDRLYPQLGTIAAMVHSSEPGEDMTDEEHQVLYNINNTTTVGLQQILQRIDALEAKVGTGSGGGASPGAVADELGRRIANG